MYFIGDVSETVNGVIYALRQTSQYYDYIQLLLSRLRTKNTTLTNTIGEEVDMNTNIIESCCENLFSPVYIQLPNDCCCYCYLLASIKNVKIIYIGMTQNI